MIRKINILILGIHLPEQFVSTHRSSKTTTGFALLVSTLPPQSAQLVVPKKTASLKRLLRKSAAHMLRLALIGEFHHSLALGEWTGLRIKSTTTAAQR